MPITANYPTKCPMARKYETFSSFLLAYTEKAGVTLSHESSGLGTDPNTVNVQNRPKNSDLDLQQREVQYVKLRRGKSTLHV
jgi:hypothetical protein